MATLQIRLDDNLKAKSDTLFSSLGMDTSTAVRIFLTLSVENDGLIFPVQHRKPDYSLKKAIYDSRTGTDLHGPFKSVEDAVSSMLEED